MPEILVIEDSALIQKFYMHLLALWGYDVRPAASTVQAVEAIRSGCVPDAIISDYNLGRGDTGVAAIRAIEGLLGRKVPAVIITGEHPQPLLDTPVFSKPLPPSHLKEVLADLVGRPA